MKRLTITVCLSILCAVTAVGVRGAEPAQAEAESFEDQMRGLGAQSNAADRLNQAKAMVNTRRYSSLQVKAIAARLGDDDARLEFALAAYPRTVDPENFYEVYDAFKTFSKVFRLHDSLRARHPHPQPGPVVTGPPPVTDQDLRNMLAALRKESFDKDKVRLARQILGGGGRRFQAAQVKQIVACMDFEPAKLEVAKFAYDYTVDRENYFVVNDAFSFSATKDSLSRYIESR